MLAGYILARFTLIQHIQWTILALWCLIDFKNIEKLNILHIVHLSLNILRKWKICECAKVKTLCGNSACSSRSNYFFGNTFSYFLNNKPIKILHLTLLFPMYPFSTPWKHQKAAGSNCFFCHTFSYFPNDMSIKILDLTLLFPM